MKFNWVTFKVSDLEKSVAFYTELLNLEIAARFGSEERQIVMLGKADETKVELIFEPNGKVENPGKGVSIGFEIDDLDGLVRLLKESGKNVIGPRTPNPHIRYFFVKDPDGYSVQLVEQK
ncbi:MAG: VOC family protein [Anaerotignaceae bacterium]